MCRHLLICAVACALAGCMEGTKSNPLPRASETGTPKAAELDRKQQAALLRVHLISRAVLAYRAARGAFPESLETLTRPAEGTKPYIGQEMLTDPWGQPIAYDVSGPRNKGTKPDVWSTGPDGKPEQEIGNWMPIGN